MNTRLLFAVALVHVICEFLPSYPDPQEPSRIRWTRSCARIAGFSVCLWAFALDASVWPLFLAAVIAQTILDDCVDPNSGLRGLLCDQLLHAATLLA